jgi:arylsulfate sulfotransferase
MKHAGSRSFAVAIFAAVAITACGGSDSSHSLAEAVAGTSGKPASGTLAAASSLQVVDYTPGPSPFISMLRVGGIGLQSLATVEFTIAPKPGAASKPVDVSYTYTALVNRGFVATESFVLTLPVFGLYAGYANEVTLHLGFQDGSVGTLTTVIATSAYTDPSGIYSAPNIIQKRIAGTALGLDYFIVKSAVGSPIILDSDAEIRWVVPGVPNSSSSAFQNDEFVIGNAENSTVYRLRLDGDLISNPLVSSNYTSFHHNIDPGKVGLLAEVQAEIDGVKAVESNVIEINDIASILKNWDVGAIISAYMLSQGDDPTKFVRPGIDWFHNNATTYDPSDDSVVVSSRENFVIKIDYATGNIIWILGDPTKYWYTFASLRAKALTLAAPGLYPVGQHAVSITSDGYLLLFNDGLGSANQPAGEPAGVTRTYSSVDAYSINKANLTAVQAWGFDFGQSVFSSVCSSAYEGAAKSVLVDYATADNITKALIVGLDANHTVQFEFEYPTSGCNTSWNAIPIALEALSIS